MTIASLFSNALVVVALTLLTAASAAAQTEAATPPPVDRAWNSDGQTLRAAESNAAPTEVVTPPPVDRGWLRALSADPNAPRSLLAIDHRGDATTRLSMRVPIVGDLRGPGLFAHLLPLVELDHGFIPHATWRARLAVEVGWTRPILPRSKWGMLELSGGAMHESDHITVQHRGAVYTVRTDAVVLNDLFARAAVHVPRGDWIWSTAATLRFHLLTCTVAGEDCAAGTIGSRTIELAGSVTGAGRRPWVLGFAPFVSAVGSWMGEHDRAAGESRIDLRAGLSMPRGRRGAWQFSVDVRHGDPMGVARGLGFEEGRYGVSVSWVP